MARGQSGLSQADSLLVGRLGNGGSLVIANMGVERSHQHQRLLDQRFNPFVVRLNARGTVLVETDHAIGQQANALQKVVDHHGPEHVEFEIARRPTHPNRHIVAHDLSAQHGHGLALRRVDLAGHDGRARLVFRDGDLAQPAARPAGQPTHIVGNLHQTDRQPLERAVSLHQGIAAGQGFKLVRCRHQVQPGQVSQFFGHGLGIARRGVQARAHGRAAQGQLTQVGHGCANVALGMV